MDMIALGANRIRTGTLVLPRHGACLVCRKRKLRCDGTKPGCYECLATNRKCQYEDDNYKTPTQLLRDQIKELETRIGRAEAGQDKALSTDSSSQRSSNEQGGSSSDGSTQTLLSLFSFSPLTSMYSPQGPTPSGSALRSLKIAPDEPEISLVMDHLGLSLDQTKRLLDIFLIHSFQCGFELRTSSVMENILPGAAEPIIPALLNAILLMGCHFAKDPSLKFWESMLILRVRHSIENNIDRAYGIGEGPYNPLHHLQAMIMIGVYYYLKGRLLEGHIHITQAARFATVLGVNRLNSRIFHQNTTSKDIQRCTGPRRWYPRDPLELGEAINMWWMCSTWDLGGSAMNGLPVTVFFDEVTTVWPRSLSDFEPGHALPDDDYSVAALLDPELSHIVADASEDNPKALVAKAGILMQYASKLDSERVTSPRGLAAWWDLFERCDYSLDRFMNTMPPISLARNSGELAFCILVHNAIHSSRIQLHCVQAEYELTFGAQGNSQGSLPLGGISYSICTEACGAIAQASTFALEMPADSAYIHVFSGIAWVCASEVIVRDVSRLRMDGRTTEAEEKERQGEVLERCLEKLTQMYSGLGPQLEQLRAKKKDHLYRFCGSC